MNEHADGPVVARHLVIECPLDIAVIVPVTGVERDEPHAGFDQPACQQGLFAPAVAIGIARGLIFVVEFERGSDFTRHHDVEGLLIDVIQLIELPLGVDVPTQRVELRLQCDAVHQSVSTEAVREGEAPVVTRGQASGFVAIAELAIAERIVSDAEPRGSMKAEAAVVHVDRSECPVSSRPEQVRSDGTHRRLTRHTIGTVGAESAGQHPMSGGPVIAVAM